MSSTSDPRFICLYGTEWSPQLKSDLWVWYAADIDNNHLLQLLLFHIPDPEAWDRAVVYLGSKIYCFMAGSCHVLCLDTTRPEIGWTTIYSPLLKRKVDSFPAVADGKIYLVDSFLDKPWAEVFDPCNQNWTTIYSPLFSKLQALVLFNSALVLASNLSAAIYLLYLALPYLIS